MMQRHSTGQILCGLSLALTVLVAANAASALETRTNTQTVTYSCNEGIPLVVRYENVGDESTAFVSHDSFPEVKLPQVVSGSGARYATGPFELHTKGRTAVFTFDGAQDVCEED